MSVVRRIAIFVIVAAAIVTALAGAAFIAFVAANNDFAAGWRTLYGVLGVGVGLVAGMCAYVALRDMVSGRLPRAASGGRGRRRSRSRSRCSRRSGSSGSASSARS
jgi:hypothetical protein